MAKCSPPMVLHLNFLFVCEREGEREQDRV